MLVSLLKRLPPAGLLALAVVLLLVASSVATLSVSNVGTRNLALGLETMQADTSIDVRPRGLGIKGGGNADANATDCASPREAKTTLPTARTALTKGNYFYRADIKETAPDAWPDAEDRLYQVELYADDTLMGTVYFTNTNGNDTAIEGVNVRIDLGISSNGTTPLPDKYNLIITRLTTCP